MNCRQAQDHLFANREAALPTDERAALATHVSGCAACRTLQHDLTEAFATWQADTNGARIPDAAMEWQKVRRRLHGEPAAGRSKSVIAWIAMPLAAAAAVAIGLYVAPSQQNTGAAVTRPVAVAVASSPTVASVAPAPSTVVYVDDKSGWTFVWGPDSGGPNGQHI